MRTFARFTKAHQLSDPLSKDDILAYHRHLRDELDAKPATIERRLVTLKSYFAWRADRNGALEVVVFSNDDRTIDALTIPLFQGEPIDLDRPFYADLKKAHDKYPTLTSCMVKSETADLQISAAFDWSKYDSEDEVIVCMTAVAQWAKNSDRIFDIFSQTMAQPQKLKTGGSKDTAYLIVSGGFDRSKYPRQKNRFWKRTLFSNFMHYSITEAVAGISVSYQGDGAIYQVKPIYVGK